MGNEAGPCPRLCLLNVQGLMSAERRALLTQCLGLHRIDACFITETHLQSKSGESWPPYEFFASGLPQGRKCGVGLLVRQGTSVAFHPISERVAWATLKLSTGPIHVLIAYSPREGSQPLESLSEEHSEFWTTVHRTLSQIYVNAGRSPVLVVGDWNVTLGRDSENSSAVLPSWVGLNRPETSVNGNLLIDFCESRKLVVANSRYTHPLDNTLTWYHYRTGEGTAKDLVLCKLSVLQKVVRDIKSVRNWVFKSDHAPVVITLRRPVTSGRKASKNLNARTTPSPRISFGETSTERAEIKEMVNLCLEETLPSLKEITWPALQKVLLNAQLCGPSRATLVQGVFIAHQNAIGEICRKGQSEIDRTPVSAHRSIRQRTELRCQALVRERFNAKLNFLASKAELLMARGDLRGFWHLLNTAKKYARNRHWAPLERKRLPFTAKSFAAHCEQQVFPPVTGEQTLSLGDPKPTRWDLNGLPTFAESWFALNDLKTGKAAGQDSHRVRGVAGASPNV